MSQLRGSTRQLRRTLWKSHAAQEFLESRVRAHRSNQGATFPTTSSASSKRRPAEGSPNYGRDHHPRCFNVWMAGGGVKPGLVYGATDDVSYNIVDAPVHVHDFQATLLRLLGIDHERLTYFYQGRRFRLTDVHGKVVDALLG